MMARCVSVQTDGAANDGPARKPTDDSLARGTANDGPARGVAKDGNKMSKLRP